MQDNTMDENVKILVNYFIGGKSMAANQKIRIKLKAYDHAVLDQSAEKIVEIAKSIKILVSSSKEELTRD